MNSQSPVLAEALTQLAYAMGFAVRHEEHTLGVEDSVGAGELAGEGVRLGAVASLAGAEHGRDDSCFQIYASNDVIFGIRQIEAFCTVIRQALGPAECGV